MVQLRVLTGKSAGRVVVARRFPCRIGRAAGTELRLEEAGVWDQHLSLTLEVPNGFRLSVLGEALAGVNGRPFQETFLRNGDLIELGSVKLQFWLGEPRQSSPRLREALTWLLLAALAAGEVALVYWLQR